MRRRYYIDERVGCLAVRDSSVHNEYEPGLDSNAPGVIRYWHGEPKVKICSECGRRQSDGWYIPPEYRQEAQALCDELNAANTDGGEPC